jgi:hypothetical protein
MSRRDRMFGMNMLTYQSRSCNASAFVRIGAFAAIGIAPIAQRAAKVPVLAHSARESAASFPSF